MALRLWKRKRPDREDKQLKERFKISGAVLDDQTVDVLIKLINDATLLSLDYPLAQGKEAVVFRATTTDHAFAAVKIYKYETTSFRTMAKYIEGDPRFAKAKRSLRPLVKQWSRKEFSNLELMRQAGVRVPNPLACRDNVIAMELIGDHGLPAPKLHQADLEDPERVARMLLDDVAKIWKAGLAHADLSEYNVLYHRGEPWIIDVGQAVLRAHPRAMEFLTHDVHTVCRFFQRLNVPLDPDAELKKVLDARERG